MSKKLLVLLVAMGAVVLLIAGLSTLKQKDDQAEDSGSSLYEMSEIIIIPSEMPTNISMDIPIGFTETASAYYDKYYVKDDASVIITGEELVDYSMDTERYAEEVKKQYADTADGFQLKAESSFECSNTTCKLLEFIYDIKGEEKTQAMQCITAVAVKEGSVYIVTCKSRRETFPGYASAFRQMIGTIDIPDKPFPTATDLPQTTDMSMLTEQTILTTLAT